MGGCTNWTPRRAATVTTIGERWLSIRCILFSLLGFFMFLLGQSWATAELPLPHAADVSGERAPEVVTPTASGALAHTLRLLNPSSSTIRALRAIEEQRSQRVHEPIPVCSQSKYLCQVYTLHSALPYRHLVAAAQTNRLNTAHDVEKQSAVPGLRSSLRSRRLAAIPFKIPKQQQQGKANAQKRNGLPGATKTITPAQVENLSIKIPKFTQVAQKSGRDRIFLPLRVQTSFTDFPHVKNNVSHTLSIQNLHGLAGRRTEGEHVAPSSNSSLEGQAVSRSIYSRGFSNGAKEGHHSAEWLSDALRFFQIEVVPSAIWWLQRIVTVERLRGPLIIKLPEERNEKLNELDKCGMCQLPPLRRLQNTTENPPLGIVEGADILLLFRIADNSEESSHVCQVDENYRPTLACISVPYAEVEGFYANKDDSFSQAVERVLAYIINGIAVNIQTLPYFLTWDPTWRHDALRLLGYGYEKWLHSASEAHSVVGCTVPSYRRLRYAGGPGSAVSFHAVTQVSTLISDTPEIQKKKGALEATAASPVTEIRQHMQHRFFLTTPGMVNAIQQHCGYKDAPGLELALNKSGPSFFVPLYKAGVVEPGARRTGELSTELLLAALEDTGWYLTDTIWSTEPLRRFYLAIRDLLGEMLLLCTEYVEENRHSLGVSEKKKSNGGLVDARSEVLQKIFLNNSEYEHCVKEMMALSRASAFEGACHRIMCVSDDDRIEAPMMLPTSKPVKWVAAQVISRLPNGIEKTTVCMRGERGQEKQAPGASLGTIQCPDVDLVCYGRPCKNGGIPKYGVCICKPGTFGRNCEYADTERNRLRYPNRFSYAPNSSITVLKGKFFAIPAFVDGPHQLYFRPISKLPAGVAIDSSTGAIFGTPVEVTKGCVPLAIEVQMREMPHAAERTLIRINVVEHLLSRGIPQMTPKIDYVSYSQGSSRAPETPSLNEDTDQRYRKGKRNEDIDKGNPNDCARYVHGDMRGQP